MKNKIYYLRHAEPRPYTADQVRNYTVGLSENGIRQARQAGQRLVDRGGVSGVIHSNMDRVVQTVDEAFGMLKEGPVRMSTSVLREVHYGNPTSDSLRRWLETGLPAVSDVKWLPGETVAEVRGRLRKFLSEFKKVSSQSKEVHNILIGAHGLLYSVLLLELNGLSEDAPVLELGDRNKILDHAEIAEVDLSEYY